MSNKTLVLNDLHLGVQRTGGTTLASAVALREFLLTRFAELLTKARALGCSRVLINGDLTDTYDTPLMQALCIYEVADAFLANNPDIEMTWALGNHDLSKDSSRLGTVAFVGALLGMRHKGFTLIDKAQALSGTNGYVIPHVTNQDLFDLELTRVPDGTKWLFVHANLDNKFACASDHSLDMTRDQAKEMKKRGITTVFGHEHQGRVILGGAVIVVGNQVPSSISDCLEHGDGQKDGTKRCLVIDHDTDTHEFHTTWTPDDADGWFAKVDWRDLAGIEEEGSGFIRVGGTATAAEAADVIKSISAFRQKSKSYVVTNAVQIETVEGLTELSDSIEDIKSVNILDLLLEHLDPKQQEAVKGLYAGVEK